MTTCPQCGAQNFPGIAYCEHCGAPLSAPEQAPAQPTDVADTGAATAIAQAQSLLDSLGETDAPATTAAPTASAAPVAPSGPASQPRQPDTEAAPIDATPEPTPAQPVLTFLFQDGSRYAVDHDVTNIGRSDIAQQWHPELDLIPYGGGAPDLGVSRHHALIQRDGATFSLVDVGSTNGTFVNGKPLEYNKPVELHDGDTIAFGAFNTRISVS